MTRLELDSEARHSARFGFHLLPCHKPEKAGGPNRP